MLDGDWSSDVCSSDLKYHSTIFIKMKDATWFKRLAFGAALGVGRAYAKARLDAGRPVPIHLKTLMLLADGALFRTLKKRLGFERLRMAISAAAPISPDVLRFYHSIGVPLRQLYGQTEGTGPTTCHRGDLMDPANTGPPIPGVEIKIAADGEILVKGPNVFKGYFKNPEATAETIRDSWLHSGDVGEIDERGFLKITDRKKDLIITSGGKNITPQNIENQLKFSPYINDAVIIGDKRHFLTALIIIDEDNVVKFAQDHRIQFTTYASLTQAPEVNRLIAEEVRQVNKDLARVETIKKFTILPKKLLVEDGEVTPTMKVKRKYINQTFSDLIEAMYRGGGGVSV
jgi:long-chain acyl-CoA synthetase